MDLVATFFLFIALYLWQRCLTDSGRPVEWVFLFAALGLSQLSKEVFALIAPVTLAAFLFAARPARPWRFFVALVTMELVWAGVLLSLLRRDALSGYPYSDVIGRAVQTGHEQIVLAARALIEGATKGVLARHLSLLPPRLRGGPGAALSPGTALVILGAAASLLGTICTRGGWWLFWGIALFSGVGVYLAIPNLNIGSEHYWYFPAAAALSLLVPAFYLGAGRVSARPELWSWLFVTALSIAWLGGLQARTGGLATRLDAWIVEVEEHPESGPAWSNVAVALLEKGTDPAAATPFVDHALALAPEDPNVMMTELIYWMKRGNLRRAERSLGQIEGRYPGKPERLAGLEFNLGLLADSLGDCPRATTAFRHAHELVRENEEYRRAAAEPCSTGQAVRAPESTG
jgi:hypothetical protein